MSPEASHDPEHCRQEIDRLRRRLAANDEFVSELGQALARLREHRGWYEDRWEHDAQARADAAEKRISQIEASTAWRIGRVITLVPGKIRRILRHV